jgi:glycosyltransferase involved in cell wall biosynthesis
MSASCCVLIPCLNEEDAIARVVTKIRELVPLARILVVDNGSTDATAQRARDAGAEVLSEPRRGKARAVLRGLQYIDEPFLILIDGDGSYPAEGIPLLLQAHQKSSADMLVGVRCPAEGHEKALRPLHQLGGNAFAKVMQLFFRWKPRDIFSGLRLLTRRFYKNTAILGYGFELEVELTVQCLEKGFVLEEVDVPFHVRYGHGVSKLKTVRDGLRILRLLLLLFRDYKPFVFFTVLSGVLTGCGLLAGFLPIYEYFLTGLVLRMPLAILAVGFINLASITFLTGVMLESNLRHHREIYQINLRR